MCFYSCSSRRVKYYIDGCSFCVCGTFAVIVYLVAQGCPVSLSAPASGKASSHCPLCHNNFMPGEEVRLKKSGEFICCICQRVAQNVPMCEDVDFMPCVSLENVEKRKTKHHLNFTSLSEFLYSKLRLRSV